MKSSLVVVLPLLFLVVCPYAAVSYPAGTRRCTRLFSLGDSLTDAGNFASLSLNRSVLAFPYGETFFRRPTGRFCDGRLIVDFIGRVIYIFPALIAAVGWFNAVDDGCVLCACLQRRR